MEEIVARRRNSLGVGFVAIIVVGLVLGIVCVVIGVQNDEPGAIYVGIAVGLILIAAGVWQCVKFFKTPAKLIVYRDGLLYLGNQTTCSPLDVAECNIYVTRRNGVTDKWGKLEIILSDGRKFILPFVDCIKGVQMRLSEIKADCYDELVRRQNEEYAAQQPASGGEIGDDPFGV